MPHHLVFGVVLEPLGVDLPLAVAVCSCEPIVAVLPCVIASRSWH